MKNKIIVYHSKDPDGWFSAYLMNKLHYNAIMYPYNYQDESEWMNYVKLTKIDFNIIFVDVTPPIAWLKENQHMIDYIQIFDHHKQKYDEIVKLFGSDMYCGFNAHQSACKIIQGTFFTFNEDLEKIANLISYYDTWKFSTMDNTEYKNSIIALSTFLFSLKDDLTTFHSIRLFFDDFVINLNKKLEHYIAEGSKIIEANKLKNAEIIKNSSFVNSIFLLSNEKNDYFLIEDIYQKHNDTKFIVAANNTSDNLINLSIRSKTEDCAKFAKEIKETGGGHYGAAGVNLTLNEFINFIYNHIYERTFK